MKNILKIILLAAFLLLNVTGCFKKDHFQDINIITTIYASEYITNVLYGENANIESIYPNGVLIDEYTITNKKLNDFSKADLFIYNGLSNEKDIAATLLNKNSKMNIIDISQGLEIKNHSTELWLSPSNFLMIAQNIKNGLQEYITNTSLLESINENYEKMKIQVSEFDAELKLIAENAVNNKLIVIDNTFKILEKYGFEVITLADIEENSNTKVSQAKNLFTEKKNHYLFKLASTKENELITTMVNNGAKIVNIHNMDTLSDDDLKNDLNYITIMKDMIDNIKAEVY